MPPALISPTLASAAGGPLVLATAAQAQEVRVTRRHRHARGQLFGATRGLLSVEAGDGRWVVPATYAVWIPPEVEHGLRSHGPFAGWSVYVQAAACAGLPAAPRTLAVSGLLREAVARAAGWRGDTLDAAQQRIAEIILDEVRSLPRETLGLPLPRDARLLKIAYAISDRPDDERSLEAWAAWAGLSPRTLSRRFPMETGVSLTAWRQRARLLRALEMLAAGRAVTAIALDLGYANVSAFIALFKRSFGVTPGRYEAVMQTGAGGPPDAPA